MGTFIWPSEDGWPYPDGEDELVDLAAGDDDELLNLRAYRSHLLDGLDWLEREVIASTFGLDGHTALTMSQIEAVTGAPSDDLREAIRSGLAKLRLQLS